jgi:hypothetical protein
VWQCSLVELGEGFSQQSLTDTQEQTPHGENNITMTPPTQEVVEMFNAVLTGAHPEYGLVLWCDNIRPSSHCLQQSQHHKKYRKVCQDSEKVPDGIQSNSFTLNWR